MSQTKITFIIDKVPYALTATDAEAIKKMPSAARQQLVALLEAVKQEESPASPGVISAAASAKPTTQPTTESSESQSSASQPMDPDALMARLAIEERTKHDPEQTKLLVYKWVAGIVIGFFVLIFIL